MKVAVITRDANPRGGESLSALRLAGALAMDGSVAVTFAHQTGSFPAKLAPPGVSIEEFEPGAAPESIIDSDVAIAMGHETWEPLVLVRDNRPCVLFASTWPGICPAGSRYWSRLGRECPVTSGWKCLGLQVACGCIDWRAGLDPRRVLDDKRLARFLSRPNTFLGVYSCDGADKYRRLADRDNILVAPPLPYAPTVKATAHAQPIEEDALVFIGRLTKGKGADLLPELARSLPTDLQLLVVGDGYLRGQLESHFGIQLAGSHDQEVISETLRHARGVLFPSMWPEPGGIVGVDAFMHGAPVAAFDVGSPRSWPGAHLAAPRDVAELARWATSLPARTPDTPDTVRRRAEAYYRCVSRSVVKQLADALNTGSTLARTSARSDPFEEALRQASLT